MSKFAIHTEVIINVPVSKVWSCLVNLPGYNDWNRFITNINGQAKIGSMLDIEIHPLGKKNQKYKVTVLEILDEKIFSWRGHFLIPGLIDGHHTLELVPVENLETKLIHREKFTGLLLPFVWNSFIVPRLKPGFYDFNLGLKNFLEKIDTVPKLLGFSRHQQSLLKKLI